MMLGKSSLLILFSAYYTLAKVSETGQDPNLGWPNFFNPKQSILRESEDKDTRRMEEKYRVRDYEEAATGGGEESSSGGEEENEEEEEEEGLIDYTMKGGLRGTYVLLNSSANIEYLDEEAKLAIKRIMKADKKLFAKVDNSLAKGETTEEGVKLRTPMVLKTHSKSLGKYGSRISFFAGEESVQMIHFGNWCGRGGRSAPVDNIDGCCLEQEKCYGKLVRHCPDVWKKPYSRMYAWLLMNSDPVCVRSDLTCINNVCECDREASLCLSHFVRNPAQIPLHVDASPLFSKRAEKKKTEDYEL